VKKGWFAYLNVEKKGAGSKNGRGKKKKSPKYDEQKKGSSRLPRGGKRPRGGTSKMKGKKKNRPVHWKRGKKSVWHFSKQEGKNFPTKLVVIDREGREEGKLASPREGEETSHKMPVLRAPKK